MALKSGECPETGRTCNMTECMRADACTLPEYLKRGPVCRDGLHHHCPRKPHCRDGECQGERGAAVTNHCKACGLSLDPRSGICRIFDLGGHKRPDNCPLAQRERDELFSPQNEPTVGDVNSSAPGTGSRFNGGKPPMEMIPVWIVARGFLNTPDTPTNLRAWATLKALGDWQRDHAEIHEVFDELSRHAPEVWEECAHVFKYACTVKRPTPYPMWNWAKGMPWSVPTACAVRHLLAMLRGEELDPETKQTHRGHVLCNLVMLAQYEATYPEGDDRPREIRRRPGLRPA